MRNTLTICRACGKELVRNHFQDKMCDACYELVYGEKRKISHCSYFNAKSGLCKKESFNFVCPFRTQATCVDYTTK